MQLFTNSLEGVFLKRPNRFIIFADTEKGVIRAHCPNPGRLLEMLVPGRRIILEQNSNPGRATGYTLAAVYYKGKIISLHTARANKVVQELVIPLLFPGAEKVLAEQTLGTSRFDFYIPVENRSIYLEVKSCTLVENGIAMFPDAPTVRGTRHVNELAGLPDRYGKHYKGHVLFLIGHPDCRLFVPNIHTDPDFSLALQAAEKKIAIHAVSMRTGTDGTTVIERLDIPVLLSPVEWVKKDTGSYVLIIYIEKKKQIQIGSLGSVCFDRGYYCYTGSALRNLHHRIKRHLKKKKKLRWHVDFFTKEAGSVKAYPVYGTLKLECGLAAELKPVSDNEIHGFGCSDCGCVSHLFYFRENPEKNEAFISVLFKYRHFHGVL